MPLELIAYTDPLLSAWQPPALPEDVFSFGSGGGTAANIARFGNQIFAHQAAAGTSNRYMLNAQSQGFLAWSIESAIPISIVPADTTIYRLPAGRVVQQDPYSYKLISSVGVLWDGGDQYSLSGPDNAQAVVPALIYYDGEWSSPGMGDATPYAAGSQALSIASALQNFFGYPLSDVPPQIVAAYDAVDHATVLIIFPPSVSYNVYPVFARVRIYLTGALEIDAWNPPFNFQNGLTETTISMGGAWWQQGSMYGLMLTPSILTAESVPLWFSSNDGRDWTNLINTPSLYGPACPINDTLNNTQPIFGLYVIDGSLYCLTDSLFYDINGNLAPCSHVRLYQLTDTWRIVSDWYAQIDDINQPTWDCGSLLPIWIEGGLICINAQSSGGGTIDSIVYLPISTDPSRTAMSFAQTENFMLTKRQLAFFARLGLTRFFK